MSEAELEQARFLQRMNQLNGMLSNNVPGYEELLKIIHRNLSQDENLLHILDEEQIGVIINGLSRRKNIIIADTAQKNASKKKSPKGLEDFM